jgi:hypothetical protein
MTATTRTACEVLDRYDEAFRLHDPALLEDLVADECVIEDTSPAPHGARHEGGRACLARWSELAGNRALSFRQSPRRSTVASPSHRGSCNGATASTTGSAA